MVLILIAVANFGKLFMDVVTKITNRIGIERIEMIKYLLQKTDETVQSFKLVNSKQIMWRKRVGMMWLTGTIIFIRME